MSQEDEMEKSIVDRPADGSRVFLYKEDYVLFGLMVRHGLAEMRDHDALALYQAQDENRPSLMDLLCESSESPEKIRKDLQTLLDLLSTKELRNYLPQNLPLIETVQLWKAKTYGAQTVQIQPVLPSLLFEAPVDDPAATEVSPTAAKTIQNENPFGAKHDAQTVPEDPNRLPKPGTSASTHDTSLGKTTGSTYQRTFSATWTDATIRESLTVEDVERIQSKVEKLPLVGKVYNNHIILDKIGGGAQGDVYLAKQLTLNRYVALKKLNNRHGANSSNFLNVFRQEAQTIARINHPNIVQVYDIFAENDEAFFTMESINGKTIREMIETAGGPLRLDLVANMACQACSALSRTSEDNLVHRDIKPANMMLDPNGNLKIVDFGLAAASASLTKIGGFAGTPIYGAPEQFDGENLTPAIDQYSLGVTLYEALTGINPFKTKGLSKVEELHKNMIPDAPSVLNTELPKEVDSVLLKMLAKKPADRFANFDDCYKAWEKILSRSIKSGASTTAALLGESLIRLGKEESKALQTRGILLGGAWVFLAVGAIIGNSQLQSRNMHAWLEFAGNAGTAILVFSLFCIFYVSMARQKYLPTIGSLRGWLFTHIATAIPAIILLLLHSGNFLANIAPGPPQAKPVISILITLTLIITAVSGSVGLLIFRALRKQIQINELGLRKGQQLNPRQAMMTALSAQLLSGWRLVHYPLAVLFVVLSLLHISVSLQYNVQEPAKTTSTPGQQTQSIETE